MRVDKFQLTGLNGPGSFVGAELVSARGRLVLEKSDDATKIRKALRLAAKAMNHGIRFPIRGEEGSVSFYLQEAPKRRGRPRKGEEPAELALPKPRKGRRGRLRKAG